MEQPEGIRQQTRDRSELGPPGILGAFRTTPTAALQTEATLPPAHIHFSHSQRKYAIRILAMPKSHPTRRRRPVSFPTEPQVQHRPQHSRHEMAHDTQVRTHRTHQTALPNQLPPNHWYNFDSARKTRDGGTGTAPRPLTSHSAPGSSESSHTSMSGSAMALV